VFTVSTLKHAMDNPEEELAWILSQPPIDMRDVTGEKLIQEYEKRLSALLESTGNEPTAEGWRDLALHLAVRYERALQVITSADPLPGSGRPSQDVSKWMLWGAVISQQRLMERKAIRKVTFRAAATAIHKVRSTLERAVRRRIAADPENMTEIAKTPSLKTLVNMKQPAFPQAWRRTDYVMEAERAARQAARRLEARRR
jgi:hypothetical protein